MWCNSCLFAALKRRAGPPHHMVNHGARRYAADIKCGQVKGTACSAFLERKAVESEHLRHLSSKAARLPLACSGRSLISTHSRRAATVRLSKDQVQTA